MIPIYICEDDPVQKDHFIDTINKAILINNYHTSIKLETDNPIEILSDISHNQCNYAIFFLDIELESKGMNGIELAKRLKEINSSFKIIFISSHIETALMIHKMNIEAFDFIVKENPKSVTEEVRRTLLKLFGSKTKGSIDNDIIKLSFDDEILFYPIDDIQYFCTIPGSPHKLEIHLINEQFQFYGHLKEIVKVHESLVTCHKSFVVNRNNIKSINKKNRLITMINNETIPLSLLGVKRLLNY